MSVRSHVPIDFVRSLSLRTTLTAVTVLFSLPHAQYLINGDFADGFITAGGDTIPHGWGATSMNKGCCLAFDMETYHTEMGGATYHEPVTACVPNCSPARRPRGPIWSASSPITDGQRRPQWLPQTTDQR